MKWIVSTLCASLIVSNTACAEKDIEPTVKNSKLTFSIPDLDGNVIGSDDERFKGKVILIDIWGTWCPPCRESIPYLEELYAEHKEKGLVVIGIAFEEQEETAKRRKKLKRFVERNKVQYQMLDGGTTEDQAKMLPTLEDFQGYPTMIIVGRDGKVSHANTVFVSRELKKIRKEVEKALSVGQDG
jgi:thiol-disulfide isomerase/thioredoxin